MEEDYLNLDDYDVYQKTQRRHQHQTATKRKQHHCPTKKYNNSEELYRLQPQDFDGRSDDILLKTLLSKFQMSFLYPFLKAYGITYRSLRYLSVDDINTAIRSIGHRAEFREKLFTWRRKKYRTNDVVIVQEKIIPSTINSTEEPYIRRSSEDTLNNTKEISEISEDTQSNTKESITTFEDISTSIRNESLKFESDIMDELPLELEIDGMEVKKPKLEATVNLRETRVGLMLNLEELINESVFGPIMKAFYKKHGYLERKHRDELIQAVIDYVINKEIKLHCSDFAKIVDMIVNIFPAEHDSRDYYFINRKGKRNPMGRLYTKYYNTLKRMRVRDIHQEFTQESTTYMQSDTLADDDAMLTTGLTTPTSSTIAPRNVVNANDGNNIGNICSSSNSNTTQIELIDDDEFQELMQLDDTSMSAIKNFLRCRDVSWDDVKTVWSKTYLSRQEDVEHSTTKDVLQQWPKYLNARAMELFNIDFGLKFSRNKVNILKRKWSQFVEKVSHYYTSNIKEEMCKGLFALWKTKPGK
uniref:Uncharacterized protein n=1 Tax=Stomoxys calcitrans TaxID=35570 RepID=A0A1I8P736_STOCA